MTFERKVKQMKMKKRQNNSASKFSLKDMCSISGIDLSIPVIVVVVVVVVVVIAVVGSCALYICLFVFASILLQGHRSNHEKLKLYDCVVCLL